MKPTHHACRHEKGLGGMQIYTSQIGNWFIAGMYPDGTISIMKRKEPITTPTIIGVILLITRITPMITTTTTNNDHSTATDPIHGMIQGAYNNQNTHLMKTWS
jgi:hypothetical protein